MGSAPVEDFFDFPESQSVIRTRELRLSFMPALLSSLMFCSSRGEGGLCELSRSCTCQVNGILAASNKGAGTRSVEPLSRVGFSDFSSFFSFTTQLEMGAPIPGGDERRKFAQATVRSMGGLL